MEIHLIEPHGFCTGVRAAVATARRALAAHGTVFCLHELVHNADVVNGLRAAGMRFVEDLADVPDGATVLFSAHGVPPAVRRRAAEKRLTAIDTTCPFVTRAHRAARAFAARGVPVAVIGRADHVETRGLTGEAADAGGAVRVLETDADAARLPFPADRPLGVVCQTTFAADAAERLLAALRARYPLLEEPPATGVCTAARDRQRAVRAFVERDPAPSGVLVLGSAASSNTRRLAETARAAGARTWRIDGAADLGGCAFAGLARLGVTSGASTPESAVDGVLRALGAQVQDALVGRPPEDQ